VRSGPGAARTILLFHIISTRPSKQPLMVRTFLKVYVELGSYFVSARTIKKTTSTSKDFASTTSLSEMHSVEESQLALPCLFGR
jgi:hypothetical protein